MQICQGNPSLWLRSALALGSLVVATGCDSESDKPAAKEQIKPTATVAPEPPPDPHRNDYKAPTAKGRVFFDGLDEKKVNKLKGQSFVGMIAAELKFGLEGMETAEEGPVKVNTGHFFVIIDGDPVAEKTEIKEDGKHKKFGKGELSGAVPLKEGKQKLTLQLVDARDRSYGPDWASTVQVDISAK